MNLNRERISQLRHAMGIDIHVNWTGNSSNLENCDENWKPQQRGKLWSKLKTTATRKDVIKTGSHSNQENCDKTEGFRDLTLQN